MESNCGQKKKLFYMTNFFSEFMKWRGVCCQHLLEAPPRLEPQGKFIIYGGSRLLENCLLDRKYFILFSSQTKSGTIVKCKKGKNTPNWPLCYEE